MVTLFPLVRDLQADRDRLLRWPHGIVEVVQGQLAGVRLRPWPKSVSLLGVWWSGRHTHQRTAGDFCRLYYNRPAGLPNYLTLKYVVSRRGTSFQSFRGALQVLDEIARIKGTAAIVCEASNVRISARLLRRWGWERHVPQSRRRHYIKRFYGQLPPPLENPMLCRAVTD
jgi:hypothetical protein